VIVVPPDKQRRIIRTVAESCQRLAVVSWLAIFGVHMFESVPVLPLQVPDSLYVEVGHAFEHVCRKRSQIVYGRNSFDKLPASAGQTLNSNRVTVASEQV
jgi:hypothetical protein